MAGCEVTLCGSKWLCDDVVIRVKQYNVLQSPTLYYKVPQCATDTTLYYEVLQVTAKYYSVLPSTTLCNKVLRRTTLYYKVLADDVHRGQLGKKKHRMTLTMLLC